MLRSAPLFAALACAACAAPAATQAGPPNGSPAAAVTPATPPLASLYRGPCLGRCPEYQVDVYADGAVRFRGLRHVATMGEARGQLDEAQLATLTARFEAAQFQSFAGRYEHLDTSDLPLVIIAFQGRMVRHAHGDLGAPPELTQLEDDFDRLVGTKRWVTGEADR
jgi:hypothetical protein